MNLLSQLNHLPPPLVRVMTSLTDSQIANRTGLSVSSVRRISVQSGWDKQLDGVSAFLEACGVRLRITSPSIRRARRIMNSKRGLKGMIKPRKAPLWIRAQQAAQLKRLIKVS